MARRRNLEINMKSIAPADMFATLASEGIICFAPSRRDTFNLAALEALLCGCPTVIGLNCGVTDFLQDSLPDLPALLIDGENILPEIGRIADYIANYGANRSKARNAALNANFTAEGPTLEEIYNTDSHSDEAVAEELRDVYARIIEQAERNVYPQEREVIYQHVCSRYDAFFGESRGAFAHQVLPQFHNALKLSSLHNQLYKSAKPADQVAAISERELPFLSSQAFGGDRVNLFRLLADWEAARGKLIAGCYLSHPLHAARWDVSQRRYRTLNLDPGGEWLPD